MSNVIPRGVRYALSGFTWPIYVLLYTPLAMIALYSFKPVASTAPVSFAAYAVLFHDPFVGQALQRSLSLAACSSAVATLLGTLLGFGLCRFRAPNPTGFMANIPSLIIYTPIIMPSLVFGISELIFFNFVHSTTGFLAAGLGTMMIAHATFQIPYVTLTVFARLVGLDKNLFEASHDLYANGIQSFFYLTIPVIQPAIIGSFLLALTLSIDDFTISFFTSGPTSVTLPIYIYSSIARKGISPEINALGTIMVASVILLAFVYYAVTVQRGRRSSILPS
jgi:spermidine/putrescine transport system permease protein